MNATSTALLTIDLQNDFLHPEGAYGRAGQGADSILALPDRIAPLKQALTQAGGTYISAQFTLVPGRGGEPLIAAHLKKLRPFLTKGDFACGKSCVLCLLPNPPGIYFARNEDRYVDHWRYCYQRRRCQHRARCASARYPYRPTVRRMRGVQ